MRYLTSNYSATLKTGLGVVQGHCKWRRSIDHIRPFCRWPYNASLDRRFVETGNMYTELPVDAVCRQLKIWPFRRCSPFADYYLRFIKFCHFTTVVCLSVTNGGIGTSRNAKMWTDIVRSALWNGAVEVTKPRNVIELLYLVSYPLVTFYQVCSLSDCCKCRVYQKSQKNMGPTI